MNAKELERILKPLANQRRLTILKFLMQKKSATVGMISEHLKLSFKATSKHLALLASAKIVDKEQRSSYMLFSISDNLPDAARRITSLL